MIDQRTNGWPTAVVAVHDMRPGVAVTADSVRLAPVPTELTPVDPLTIDDVVGRRVTGTILSGEIIARHRLLEPRLPAELTGDPDARLVPVRPADETSTTLIRVGDVVDLLADDGDVLARAATVAVTAPADGPDRPGPVLVALPSDEAHRVAAASLRQPITFVLH